MAVPLNACPRLAHTQPDRLLLAGGMTSSASHDWATSRHVTNTSVNRSVAVLGFADVQTVFAPRSLGAIGTASAIPGGGPLGEHPDDKLGYGPAGPAAGHHQQQQRHAGQYHQSHYGSGSGGQQTGSLVRHSIGSDLGSDELRAHSRNGSFSYETQQLLFPTRSRRDISRPFSSRAAAPTTRSARGLACSRS